MLLVKLEMKARPDKRKELLQTLLAWMGPAREAPGCMDCGFHLNMESEDRFILQCAGYGVTEGIAISEALFNASKETPDAD